MTIFIIFNLLCMMAIYILLCNTAIVEKQKQTNGKHIYNKRYIIGDIIKSKDVKGIAFYVIVTLLCFIPFTWFVCICLAGFITGGYLSGNLEVFGNFYIK